jgi:hypothetical protein
LAYDRIQLRDVHGFDDVLDEARLFAAPKVLFHAVAAQGDPLDPIAGADLFHQFVPGAVGQANVADDDIERLSAASCRADATLPAVLTV